jgi:hypothetical protein
MDTSDRYQGARVPLQVATRAAHGARLLDAATRKDTDIPLSPVIPVQVRTSKQPIDQVGPEARRDKGAGFLLSQE